MRRVYFGLGVGIIVLGVVHIAATLRYFSQLTTAAVWFASGGLAIMLTGALNLLRRAYGEMAPGVRFVCVAANAAMTVFAGLAGYAGRASFAEFAVVLGVLGGATLCSVIPAAQRPVKIAPAASQAVAPTSGAGAAS
jgi:hypothetical protein